MSRASLRDSILVAAFTGKLSITIDSDELVAVLMGEISTTRKNEIKSGTYRKTNSSDTTVEKAENGALIIREKNKCTEVEAPYELPESWNWATLGSVAALYTGDSIPKAKKEQHYANVLDGYSYIGTKDVKTDHTIDYENGIRIPHSEDFRHAYAGDTLLCIEGGSAGKKIALVSEPVICFGNKLCAIHSYGIDREYLYFFLQSPVFRTQFIDGISGIIGGVSIKNLSPVLVPVPPIGEQARIVEQLLRVEPLIRQYEQLIARRQQLESSIAAKLMDSIRQSVVAEVEAAGLAEENQQIEDKDICLSSVKQTTVNLAELCTARISYGIIKLGTEPKENGIKTLRCSDVKPGYIEERFIRTVAPELSAQYQRTVLEENDVVVNVRGTLGGCAVVPKHLAESNVAREVAVIKLKDRGLSRYVMHILLSPYFRQFMQESLRGIAYKGLNMGILSSFPVPLPRREEIQEIVQTLDSAEALLSMIQ